MSMFNLRLVLASFLVINIFDLLKRYFMEYANCKDAEQPTYSAFELLEKKKI